MYESRHAHVILDAYARHALHRTYPLPNLQFVPRGARAANMLISSQNN